MIKAKGYAAQSPETDLAPWNFERREPGEHDVQLNQIYDALENLLDEKAAQRKWDDRERIGFKNSARKTDVKITDR